MKKLNIILVLSVCFFYSQAWACDENRADVVGKRVIGSKGGYQFLTCSDGVYGEPSKSQLIDFFSRMPKEKVDKWAPIMTEGAAKDKNGLLNLIKRQNAEEIPMTNITVNRKVSAAQTNALNNMLKDWNSNMDIQPQKRVNIFSPDAFNKHGKRNSELIEALSSSGKQCNLRASRNKKLSGFQFKFTDDEKMNILPVSMKKEGENTYTLKYHKVHSFSRLSSEQTRKIKVNPRNGMMTWLGSPDGAKYFIAPQKSAQKSMKSLFNMTWGMTGGGSSPLCNAESSLEKVAGNRGKSQNSQEIAN